VTPGGLVLASVIRLGIFLAPLILARAGFMSGELAGLAAIAGWFVVGTPLSYAAADTLRRRQALRVACERSPRPSASAGEMIVSSS
jgi:hypothetical protein